MEQICGKREPIMKGEGRAAALDKEEEGRREKTKFIPPPPENTTHRQPAKSYF